MSDTKSSIDIVTVEYGRPDLTYRFIESLREFRPGCSFTLTVVDNTLEADKPLSDHPDYGTEESFHYIRLPDNPGYAAACNIAASLTTSEFIGVFNNDVRFINSTSIDRCVDFLRNRPDVAMVGPIQFNSKGNLTHAGIEGFGRGKRYRGWLESSNDFLRNEPVDMIMGSAMIIRRSFWEELSDDKIYRDLYPDASGPILETPLYFEDEMLCQAAAHLGYKVYYMGEPGCEIVHEWHQTIRNYHVANKYKEGLRMHKTLMECWGVDHGY